MKALLEVVKASDATHFDVMPRLAAWVEQVLAQANFAGGSQQDAAECLMHILMSVDRGEMQRRVCGVYAVAVVENMLLSDPCRNGSLRLATFLTSHSGCLVRGTGLSIFWIAAGIVMIFWIAASRRPR